MPVIQITMGEGQADSAQKQKLIEQFTASATEITKLPAQAFTILINELSHDAIGVSGQTLTQKYAAQ